MSRILWAGPWNARSAIATFGRLVVGGLAASGHDVEVVRTEAGADLLLPPLPAPGPVHDPGAQPIAALAAPFDGVVLNLGDYYGFHGAALPMLQDLAPLVILHDAWLGNLVNGWRHYAGSEAWQVQRFLEGAPDPAGVQALCGLASGVVVHGPHYRDAAQAACAGPVAELPLAYAAPELPPPGPFRERLMLATIGHVNANKRAEAVIRAQAASERLRRRTLYTLIGPVEPSEQARLEAVARDCGAPAPHFTGRVPDEVLQALMAGTDVFCCLRHPVTEGGSASLVTAMLSGRPTLVSDHASYATVPDGLVLKCAPGREGAHVLHHLEAILDDPAAAQAMGARARAYALQEHAPEAYCARLLPVLDAATAAQPAVLAARSVGRRMAELGMRTDDPMVHRMDALLAGMLPRAARNREPAE